MSNDPFGDRMKRYEAVETDRRILHGVPIVGRVDGRAFHRLTSNFDRPYEKDFSDVMVEVTKYLVTETGAVCGYTQSDEISIVWSEPIRVHDENGTTRLFHIEQWFGGKIFKMTSNLASLATAAFGVLYRTRIDEKKRIPGLLPTFDARVFAVPNRMEAAACLWWRELDATRNSLQMAARAHFSHEQCQDKSTSQLHDMLFDAGINWNDYPAFFKRGTFVQRRTVERILSKEELENLPPKHEAVRNPDKVIRHTVISPIEVPPFTYVNNKVGVVFDGEEPKVTEKK